MFGSATLLKLMVELGISDPQNVTQKLGEVGEAGKVADEKIKPLGGTTGADGSAGKAAVGIGMIAGVIAAGKLAKKIWDVALSTSKFAENLMNLSEKTNLSLQPLQEWLYVASLADVGPDKFATAIKGLTNKMQEAIEPGSKAAKMFETLGISAVDSQGKMKSVESFLPDVIAKLADLKNETERNALMNDIFGKSGIDLVPILADGSKAIDEQRQEFHKLGFAIEDDVIKKAAPLDDAFTKMMTAFGNVKTQIGSLLAQGFTPLVDAITLKMIPAWNTLKDVVTPIFKIIWTGWVFMKDEIMGAWKIISGMLTWNFPKVWEGAKEVTMGFVNVVKGIWTTIKDSVIKGINDIKPTVIAKWNEVMTGIINPLIKLGKDAYNWGKNIVNSLWSGINSLAGTVSNFVSNFIRDHITKPIKDALHISSPSKVMQNIGEQIGMGLVIGMGNTLGIISSMAGEMAQASNFASSYKGGQAWSGGSSAFVGNDTGEARPFTTYNFNGKAYEDWNDYQGAIRGVRNNIDQFGNIKDSTKPYPKFNQDKPGYQLTVNNYSPEPIDAQKSSELFKSSMAEMGLNL